MGEVAGREVDTGVGFRSEEARGSLGISGWRGLESLGLLRPDRD
jgi:hypothetical protein